MDSLPSPPLPEAPPLTIRSAGEPVTPAHLRHCFLFGEQGQPLQPQVQPPTGRVIQDKPLRVGREKESSGWRRAAADRSGDCGSRLEKRLANPERAQQTRGPTGVGEKSYTLGL